MKDDRDYTPSLSRLARLAREQQTLMAGLLALYQEQEGWNEAQLAAFLQSGEEALVLLALCRRPRMAPAHFRPDIEQIAAYATVGPTQLARLVRAATAAEQRRSAGDLDPRGSA